MFARVLLAAFLVAFAATAPAQSLDATDRAAPHGTKGGGGSFGAPEIDTNLGRAGFLVLAAGGLILLSRRRRRSASQQSNL